MNSRFDGVVGARYFRLTAIEPVEGKARPWRFLCDCGQETIASMHNVRIGNTKSCGCMRREIGERKVVHGHRRDGKTSPTLYQYEAAKQKCFNPRYRTYAKFGGRGTTMNPWWVESFLNFLADMGECPPGLTLQLVNEGGNFDPGNCVWAPAKRRSTNKNN